MTELHHAAIDGPLTVADRDQYLRQVTRDWTDGLLSLVEMHRLIDAYDRVVRLYGRSGR